MDTRFSKRIGILGGTFNPIHYGHIELGIQALSQFDLDEVLVMPNNKPAYKDVTAEIAASHRIKMIKLAISDIPGLEYSDFEISRPGITYTSDTLEALHSLYPDVHWYFIMGGDSVMYFDKWFRPDVIARLATLIITTRSDTPAESVAGKIADLRSMYPYADIRTETIHEYDVSSSQIRANVKTGLPIDDDVPATVKDYILQNHLYETGERT